MSLRDFFEIERATLNRDDPADALGSLLASSGALRGSEPGRPITAADMLDALELERTRYAEARAPLLGRPAAQLHLDQHGGGDPACEECVTIWMAAD